MVLEIECNPVNQIVLNNRYHDEIEEMGSMKQLIGTVIGLILYCLQHIMSEHEASCFV